MLTAGAALAEAGWAIREARFKVRTEFQRGYSWGYWVVIWSEKARGRSLELEGAAAGLTAMTPTKLRRG